MKLYSLYWLTSHCLSFIFSNCRLSHLKATQDHFLQDFLVWIWWKLTVVLFFLVLSHPLCWKSRAVKFPGKHQSCLHFPGHNPPPQPKHCSCLRSALLQGFSPRLFLCCYHFECLLHCINPCVLMGEESEADRVPCYKFSLGRIGLIHVLVQHGWYIYVFRNLIPEVSQCYQGEICGR